jgi:hypothetical protein
LCPKRKNFRSSFFQAAALPLYTELPLRDCFINAKDINILLGREELFSYFVISSEAAEFWLFLEK